MKKIISKLFLGSVIHTETVDTPFDIVIDSLRKSVESNGFAVQAIHDLEETYKKNKLKVGDDFRYKIVQICNASKSHNALTNLSFDMGVMMPKSIIIARENNKTTLRFMKLKPYMVSLMFPDIDVAPISKKVTSIMHKIVEDAIKSV